MNDDYTPYIALGNDLYRLRKFFEKAKEESDKSIAVAAKYGGKPIQHGGSVAGIAFDSEPDKTVWRMVHGFYDEAIGDTVKYYMPRRTTKTGREMYSEIKSCRVLDASNLHNIFCKDGGARVPTSRGFKLLYMYTEEYSGTNILIVPKKSDFKPDGSQRLKMSDYWLMREAHETLKV